ncbi:uncharacterized protein Z520_10244 [Fonsecaea multimorphosa CBS 102226]|uniref:Major facilitator superfamily (MFS) profile domain-containing protein n=1 Tax=Fonsecaea multimorphosa CBS 102226 TaxID=1442371 RepID=A0A0D2JL00_9EURO|nr:uncharacterized protein Z520_10244 [Fonsecaea multimorphosa CBS 102226]KIX93907.1 hypothetical protein Z520_10244 [Fonsecaea multimorphosa CBS 102226]
MAHVRAQANTYNFIVAFFVALGSLTYSFNSAIIAALIGLPSFLSYFGINANTSHGASLIGACNGVYSAGGAIGCWIVNWLLDGLGRKRSIQVIAVVCIISAAIQAGSVDIAMFIVGRCLNGVGVGMINCTIPTYICEISPARQRGRVVSIHGVLIASGYGVAGWVGLGTYFEKNPSIQWRLCVALQIVAPLLLLCGSPWVPESPRWLINNNRDQEGLKILMKLHEHPSDPQNIGAREEFVQIQTQLALDRKQKAGNIFQLFRNPFYRKRLLYGFWLQAMCQSSGVLVINNYMIIILASLGVTGWIPLMLNAIYNSWAGFLNFINSLLIDRFGRIRIISIGISGGIFAVIMVTAMVANFGGPDNTNRAGAGMGVFFMFLFATFYASCVDATSYVYCSEIFPTNIRAQGVGFSVSSLFIMTTIYTSVAGPAFNAVGWRFYLVFIIVPAFMLAVVIKWFPETKNLSLEEIGALFGEKVAIDLSHLSEAERQEFDDRLAQAVDMSDIINTKVGVVADHIDDPETIDYVENTGPVKV